MKYFDQAHPFASFCGTHSQILATRLTVGMVLFGISDLILLQNNSRPLLAITSSFVQSVSPTQEARLFVLFTAVYPASRTVPGAKWRFYVHLWNKYLPHSKCLINCMPNTLQVTPKATLQEKNYYCPPFADEKPEIAVKTLNNFSNCPMVTQIK